jgi:hypothetical protein
MSTNPNPLQCLHDAIARIHHELRTRTWLSIHEVLGDDGQEYQTLNLRHHILVSTSMQVWQEDRVHHTKNKKRKAGEIRNQYDTSPASNSCKAACCHRSGIRFDSGAPRGKQGKQQTTQKHQANYWGHSVKLLFIGSKGTPIILDTG